MRGHAWKSALGLILTVLLLWWVLRDVSIPEVWQRVRAADPWLLTGAGVVATFSFVLRALRWRVLLSPSHPDSRFVPRFGATCIGFAVNNLLPARLGQVVGGGPHALDFLQYSLSNNAAALEIEEGQYTMIPNENGGAENFVRCIVTAKLCGHGSRGAAQAADEAVRKPRRC